MLQPFKAEAETFALFCAVKLTHMICISQCRFYLSSSSVAKMNQCADVSCPGTSVAHRTVFFSTKCLREDKQLKSPVQVGPLQNVGKLLCNSEVVVSCTSVS